MCLGRLAAEVDPHGFLKTAAVSVRPFPRPIPHPPASSCLQFPLSIFSGFWLPRKRRNNHCIAGASSFPPHQTGPNSKSRSEALSIFIHYCPMRFVRSSSANDYPSHYLVNASEKRMQACDRCHARKTRCDRRMPQCSACEKVGAACLHVDKIRQRQLPRGYMDSMETKLQELGNENQTMRRELAALRSQLADQARKGKENNDNAASDAIPNNNSDADEAQIVWQDICHLRKHLRVMCSLLKFPISP